MQPAALHRGLFRPPAPAAGGRFAGALSRLCTMGPACGREPGSGVRSVAPGTRTGRGPTLPLAARACRLSSRESAAAARPPCDSLGSVVGSRFRRRNWTVSRTSLDGRQRSTVTLTVFGGGSHCARPGTHLSPRVHRLRCRRARGCARGATPPREGRAVAVPLRGGGLTRAARQ